MQVDKPEIMTVQEVAGFLRVSERTVYDWAVAGTIPCGKLGTTWRFKRSEINKWVDKHLSTPSKKDISFSPIVITDILRPENIRLLSADNKDAALLEMLGNLHENGSVSKKEEVVEGIFQREKLMSTGIGLGIGIPHIRMGCIDTLTMSVGLARKDLEDYESLDGNPVRMIFMILAPENQHTQHIKTIAAISRRVRNAVLREMLMQAKDADNIYQLLTHGAPVK